MFDLIFGHSIHSTYSIWGFSFFRTLMSTFDLLIFTHTTKGGANPLRRRLQQKGSLCKVLTLCIGPALNRRKVARISSSLGGAGLLPKKPVKGDAVAISFLCDAACASYYSDAKDHETGMDEERIEANGGATRWGATR
jgi:hypothetical protein